MPLEGLDRRLEGVKVVHLSDLHFSRFMRTKHLEAFVHAVNALSPDFVVMTGDFVTNASRKYVRQITPVLSKLKPRIASLGCMGNHDYNVWHPKGKRGDVKLAMDVATALRQADVLPLINDSVTFNVNGAKLNFVGLDDHWAKRADTSKAFKYIAPGQSTIGLLHNPQMARKMVNAGADFVLSGHTHGRGIEKNKFHQWLHPGEYCEYIQGQYSMGKGKYLYVNRGVGHSYRIFGENHTEITLFTLSSISDKIRRRKQESGVVR